MSLVAAKLGGALVLVFFSLLFGLLPFKILALIRQQTFSSQRRIYLVLSCVQCFGAGVLLATVFTHILPDVRKNFSALQSTSDFPLAEVLLCSGMFTIYFIEELVECMLKRAVKSSSHAQRQDCHSESRRLSQDKKNSYGTSSEPDQTRHHHHHPSHSKDHDFEGAIMDHQGHAHLPSPDVSIGGFRVFVIAVALSVHSFFEGMAIGLDSRNSGVWMLVFAITIHKSIIAFCLGEQLASSDHLQRSSLITLFVFMVASPGGILTGMVIVGMGAGGVDDYYTGALQGLAAGSILYVVVFEIIQGEKEKDGNGLVKLAAILVGFGSMLLLTTYVKGEGSEGVASATVAPVTTTPSL